MADPPNDLLFGELAVQRGLVTKAQVETAVRLQKKRSKQGFHQSVGEILVERQFMTQSQADQLAEYQREADQVPETAQGGGAKKVGPYEVIAKLGEGGMGAVYMAREGEEGDLVALKVLPPRLARSPEFLERFSREIRNLQDLDHPNIVKSRGSGQSGGFHYLVMDFVQGENLWQVLERETRLPPRRAVDIAIQVARALDHADGRGIFHRDIKPENIIIDVQGRARVTDFGLAKAQRDGSVSRVTQDGQTVGTPYYIPPEQALGEYDRIDVRSDIYALGGTLYHMVVGEPPFDGDTPAVILSHHINTPTPWAKDVDDRAPTSLAYILDKMMAKEPSERYQTPRELIEDLDRFQAGDIPRARSDAEKHRARKRGGERPARTSSSMGTAPPRAGPAAPYVSILLLAAILALAGTALWLLARGRGAAPGDVDDGAGGVVETYIEPKQPKAALQEPAGGASDPEREREADLAFAEILALENRGGASEPDVLERYRKIVERYPGTFAAMKAEGRMSSAKRQKRRKAAFERVRDRLPPGARTIYSVDFIEGSTDGWEGRIVGGPEGVRCLRVPRSDNQWVVRKTERSFHHKPRGRLWIHIRYYLTGATSIGMNVWYRPPGKNFRYWNNFSRTRQWVDWVLPFDEKLFHLENDREVPFSGKFELMKHMTLYAGHKKSADWGRQPQAAIHIALIELFEAPDPAYHK